jgi:hypothetical protein
MSKQILEQIRNYHVAAAVDLKSLLLQTLIAELNKTDELELHNEALNDDDMQVLAKVLPCCLRLKTIVLRTCGITAIGAQALATGLLLNDSVIGVNLDQNNIGDAGATAFGTLLGKKNLLTRLYLANNAISSDGANKLAKGLENNNRLQILALDSNHNIGFQGLVSLAAHLSKNTSLTKLVLKSIPVDEHSREHFNANLGGNGTLDRTNIFDQAVYLNLNKRIPVGDRPISNPFSRAVVAIAPPTYTPAATASASAPFSYVAPASASAAVSPDPELLTNFEAFQVSTSACT